jgi:hypothetical protein
MPCKTLLKTKQLNLKLKTQPKTFRLSPIFPDILPKLYLKSFIGLDQGQNCVFAVAVVASITSFWPILLTFLSNSLW